MAVDNKRLDSIVTEEDSRLEEIRQGITEGILEGLKEGMAEGLKKGAVDGLKKSFAPGGDTEIPDMRELLNEIGTNALKTSIRESTKNVLKKPAETYVRSICTRIVEEVHKTGVELTEEQISHLVEQITGKEKEAAGRVMEKLPENPFLEEFAGGIQEALEESLRKELTACGNRLRKKTTGS